MEQFLIVVFFLVTATFIPSYGESSGSYTSIFSFGDSWADTGNTYYVVKSRNQTNNCLNSPYGDDFVGNSYGRCSNGRLIIDFIAEYLGLSYVRPYFGIELGNVTYQSLEEGVNFAIAGATVMDPSYFETRRIPFPKGYCLRNQLDWFKNLLPSLCGLPSSCRHVLKDSLFLMGEIGGNDYLFACGARKAKGELTSMVPQVINATISAVKEVMDLGAMTVLVPGTIPIGCNSIILTVDGSTDKEEYDQFGCLKWLNKLAEYHNQQLQIELHNLRMLYPDVEIFYGDYYDIMWKLVQAPTRFGFVNGLGPLKCCCGGGGEYNYNIAIPCGDKASKLCKDPSQYVYWDGAHLTEAAYRWIARSLLSKQPFATIVETPHHDRSYLSS